MNERSYETLLYSITSNVVNRLMLERIIINNNS